MKKLMLIIFCMVAVPTMAMEPTPSYLENHRTSIEDLAAINRVILDFQTAIKSKNPVLLSTLVLNSRILFASPATPDEIKEDRREIDTTSDGIDSDGYISFAKLLKKEKASIEEKFYNVKITQDAHVAWVMFDFEFFRENNVVNHGVEAWQMMKSVDGSWKIISVVWTSKGKPPQ